MKSRVGLILVSCVLYSSTYVRCSVNNVLRTDHFVELGSYKNNSLLISELNSTTIQWKNIQRNDVLASLKELTIAGLEPGPRAQYLCRAFYSDYWIPGKLVADHGSGEFSCDIGAAYEEIRFPVRDENSIQVLVAPPEYVSWIPLPADGFVPDNLIIGGQNVNGDITPICRYDDGEGNSLVGRFLLFGFNSCWYTKGGEESVAHEGIEVLATNKFYQE